MDDSNLKSLKRKLIVRFSLLPVFIGLLTLLPAWTFAFYHVYVYCAVVCIPMIFVLIYFLKKSPEFLERRMKTKEKEKEQKLLVVFSSFIYLSGYMFAGFDHRFGWSKVPFYVVIIADVAVVLGYLFVFLVFKENSYASRVVEVQEGQQVISTGPYGVIRHPMYLGVLVMFLATPIALGSYMAVVPFAFLPVSLVFRIRNEEKVLREELPGYKEYCEKVRYRLIPFVW